MPNDAAGAHVVCVTFATLVLADVGSVHAAGTTSVTMDPGPKSFPFGAANVKVSCVDDPAVTLFGDTVIEPSPLPALPANAGPATSTPARAAAAPASPMTAAGRARRRRIA